MRRADKIRILEAADGTLTPLGFTRRSRDQTWSKRTDSDRIWVHYNFGLRVVQPSFGVEYLDLKERWPELPGAVYGTVAILGTLFDPVRSYTLETPPEEITLDVRTRGLAAAAKHRDRDQVVSLLRDPNPSAWPVPGYSFRIRLAPLLLLGMGRAPDALRLAGQFAEESKGKDQMIPDYGLFLSALRDAGAA